MMMMMSVTPNFRASSSMALLGSPVSLVFQPLLLRRPNVSIAATSFSSRGIATCLTPLHHLTLTKRSISASAAAHHDSILESNREVKNHKTDAWNETLASFKEQALKMQTISQEAYESYSEKAKVILNETAENLKVQSQKAREDFSVIAKEISENGKEYLTAAAENSPEPVKDIVETFASADQLNEVSKLQDFHVGIPYGALLLIGGFLSFMLTGSISAIRFGVILGGTLLALSVSSFKSWKKGEANSLALKGQAAIATFLFLRDLSLLSARPFIINDVITLISGMMVAFYTYRIIAGDGQSKNVNLETEPQS